MDFVTNVGFIIPYKGIAFVSETPKISWRNARLHNEKDMAVKYANGYGLYSVNGVLFDKELFDKLPSMSAKEIFAIENMEQRRAAYEVMDKAKMKELGAKTLDEVKDDGYGYAMKVIQFDVKGMDLRYLQCQCPSTGRQYYLETRATECWGAKLGSFGLSKKFDKEY